MTVAIFHRHESFVVVELYHLTYYICLPQAIRYVAVQNKNNYYGMGFKENNAMLKKETIKQ